MRYSNVRAKDTLSSIAKLIPEDSNPERGSSCLVRRSTGVMQQLTLPSSRGLASQRQFIPCTHNYVFGAVARA